EHGEVAEPPMKIPAPLGRQSGDIGIALDPAHKEVIIATAAGNTIMTFSVPEVFDPAVSTRKARSNVGSDRSRFRLSTDGGRGCAHSRSWWCSSGCSFARPPWPTVRR